MVERGRIAVSERTFQGPIYDELLKPFMMGEYEKLPNEIMCEGPTGTGKSFAISFFLKAYMRRFPHANVVVIRGKRIDLAASFMSMWEEETLDWNDPWDKYMLAGKNGVIPAFTSRQFYRYPNGSKCWVRGMDQWARFKSMSFDLIWCMEMTEIEKDQLEGLKTRLRARSGVPIPWRGVIGDVNPEHPQHWANQRALQGTSTRIKTRLMDNPHYYSRELGDWTKEGSEYRTNLLGSLSGHNALRYIQGEWVSASGQILDFDETRHMFSGKVARKKDGKWCIEIPETHSVLGNFVELDGIAASYDWGDDHAGTLQIWGVCAKGRQYLIEEVYHSRRPLQWWAEQAVTAWKKYGLNFIVCDNAAKDTINRFNERLMQEGGAKASIAWPCTKRSGNAQQSNMEVLRDLFCDQSDGAPGIYLRRGALSHAPDRRLEQRDKPTCLSMEVPSYVYAEYSPGAAGRPEDRPDRGVVDDGLDACTYFRVAMLGGRKLVTKQPQDLEPVDTREGLMRWKAHRKSA
jgi:hypothetical protein